MLVQLNAHVKRISYSNTKSYESGRSACAKMFILNVIENSDENWTE